MPQRRHPSPAGENEKIAVRAVRHRVRLEGAPGEAVYAAYLLRPRACPQRRSDSLQVFKHGFEKCLYPFRGRRFVPRLSR